MKSNSSHVFLNFWIIISTTDESLSCIESVARVGDCLSSCWHAYQSLTVTGPASIRENSIPSCVLIVSVFMLFTIIGSTYLGYRSKES